MSLLIEGFPTAIEVSDVVHEIDADYRTALRIMAVFEDAELVQAEKYALMCSLLYEEMPVDYEAACRQALKFLNCGANPEDAGNNSGGPRLYSLTQDAPYIHTAINQSHRIDLSRVDFLHWWQFYYMFMDLPEGCFFNRLIYLRGQKSKGKLTPEERTWVAAMPHIVNLEADYTPEEQGEIDKFMHLLNGGGEGGGG